MESYDNEERDMGTKGNICIYSINLIETLKNNIQAP